MKFLLVAVLLFTTLSVQAGAMVTIDHNGKAEANPAFKFKNVPSPSKDDAAAHAKCILIHGTKEDAVADLDVLTDGKLPSQEDQPAENFCFSGGTDGGRIQMDLGRIVDIKQINTYSWHPSTRAAQVYRVYANDGTTPNFNPRPRQGEAGLVKFGWTEIATVDTRPKTGDPGGQYGVSIANPEGFVGKYRYLIFEISRTEDADEVGNTFYSEIDVIEQK